jgi:hypothetical protein
MTNPVEPVDEVVPVAVVVTGIERPKVPPGPGEDAHGMDVAVRERGVPEGLDDEELTWSNAETVDWHE